MLVLDFFVFFSKKKHPRLIRTKKQLKFKKNISNNSIAENFKKIIETAVNKNDFLILKLISSIFYQVNTDNFRINYRLNFFKTGFYTFFKSNFNKHIIKKNLDIFMSGWGYFLKFFSKWFLPLMLVSIFVYYSLFIKSFPLNKIIFVWLSLFMVFYWIMSGFVFFFKKYQYGKFTSAIQRFWKRTLILFWLIEGSVLLVFVFLTLNSSVYLYNTVDQSQIFKTHLFSWKLFLIKAAPITILILLTYLFLLNNKWQPLNKNLPLMIIITILLFYILWAEFFQFYHLMNYYSNLVWGYEPMEKFWSLKVDLRKTSQTNHLVSLLLILKFWHVLFVLVVWLFFVLRSEESDRVRYPLIAANFLNFVMLYLLTWVYMYPWFKWFFRRYFDYSYKWFYENNRNLGFRLFFNDLTLLLISFETLCKNTVFLSFNKLNFFYLSGSNDFYGYVDFNKKFIYTQVLPNLNQTHSQINIENNIFTRILFFFKEFLRTTHLYFFDEWFY